MGVLADTAEGLRVDFNEAVEDSLETCLDLSRFRSGLLRAILAIKETGYGRDTQRRVQAGGGGGAGDLIGRGLGQIQDQGAGARVQHFFAGL